MARGRTNPKAEANGRPARDASGHRTKTARGKPRKGVLTADGLTALGAERLAALVLEAAERDPAFKRVAKAAMASADGPKAVAAIVDRRLAALERARGFVDWDKVRPLASDLGAMVAIVDGQLAPLDPAAAADRLVRFLLGAEAVFERVDDSGGHVQEVYGSDAMRALEAVAAKLAAPDTARLAERLARSMADDGYGLVERALLVLIARLDEKGLAALDGQLAEPDAEVDDGTGGGRDAGTGERGHSIVWSPSFGSVSGGRDWSAELRHARVRRLRQAIADARGDVDAFVALEEDVDAGRADTLGVAERLLGAGRAAEALEWVRRPETGPTSRARVAFMRMQDVADGTGPTDPSASGRATLEAAILDALDRKDEAQEVRWNAFVATLDPAMLREHVDRLGDFEEFEVMDRAHRVVGEHPSRAGALMFWLEWPDLERAGRHVVAHADHWDGGHYHLLVPAAGALEEADPLAASVLYRALLADILARARSKAYGHGARHLALLDALAKRITDWRGLPDHTEWRESIEASHVRKSGFWARVEG